jgi:hypothetical protein
MRVESGQLRWRGYLALTRALALHAAISMAQASTRAWSGDQRVLPRALGMCAAITLVFAAPLIAIPADDVFRRVSWRAVVLLVPQALALAMPLSLLVAIPVAFHRTALSRRNVVRGMALVAACSVATFVVITRAVPDANQAFRLEVLRQLQGRVPAKDIHLEPGPMETTMSGLREQIEAQRAKPDGARAARRLEYAYQMRLMISVMALPLGMLALALKGTALGHRRPWTTAAAGLACLFLVFWPLELLAQRQVDHSTLPATALVWLPLLAIALLALIVARAHAGMGQPSPEHAR